MPHANSISPRPADTTAAGGHYVDIEASPHCRSRSPPGRVEDEGAAGDVKFAS
jgi:hypothetical protein